MAPRARVCTQDETFIRNLCASEIFIKLDARLRALKEEAEVARRLPAPRLTGCAPRVAVGPSHPRLPPAAHRAQAARAQEAGVAASVVSDAVLLFENFHGIGDQGEIVQPAPSSAADVPDSRALASLAVMDEDIDAEDLFAFAFTVGTPSLLNKLQWATVDWTNHTEVVLESTGTVNLRVIYVPRVVTGENDAGHVHPQFYATVAEVRPVRPFL